MKIHKNILIYYTRYVTITEYMKIYTVNPYFQISEWIL